MAGTVMDFTTPTPMGSRCVLRSCALVFTHSSLDEPLMNAVHTHVNLLARSWYSTDDAQYASCNTPPLQ